ncbi:hypothetical protein ACQZQZ_09590 [Aeromonas salmonicida subsp. pectinolytica]
MEKYLDNVDAIYYGVEDDYDGKGTIPLFLSKRDAICFLNSKKLQKKFAVRGLTQRNLEVLIEFGRVREGANKRGNSSRLTQSFHFFMFEPIFSPVNASNQPI